MITIDGKTSSGNNILTISSDVVRGASYQLRMFQNNDFGHFLKPKVTIVDNIPKYEYEIQGYVSVKEKYEKNPMSKEEIVEFVHSLNAAISELKECLIDMDNILLRPECIFATQDRGSGFLFCFCESPEENFFQGIKKVLEFFLEHVDYNDKEAVVTIYEIYHKITRDNVPPEVIERDITKVNNVSREYRELVVEDTAPKIYEHTSKDTNKEPEKESNEWQRMVQPVCTTIIVILIFMAWYPGKIFPEVPQKVCFGLAVCFAVIILIFRFLIVGNKNKSKEEAPAENNAENTRLLGPEDIMPYLIYEENGEEKRAQISTNPYLIGSQKERTNLHLKSKSVSRIHARIFNEGKNYYIEDMNSTNGTKVNDRKLRANEVMSIEDGDIVVMADVEFIIKL